MSYENQIEGLKAQLERASDVTPGYDLCSNYGFSFEYPATWSFHIMGLVRARKVEHLWELPPPEEEAYCRRARREEMFIPGCVLVEKKSDLKVRTWAH